MLKHSLNERSRRLWAAAEAQALGYGGGPPGGGGGRGSARSTIVGGMKETQGEPRGEEGRVRRTGGGRKQATAIDPSLSAALKQLVGPVSRGGPQSPLRGPRE